MSLVIPGAIPMETINSADRIKLALCGDPGSGKSWLAVSGATQEEQAFNFDFDGRIGSIAGKKFVTGKTYIDVNFPALMPMAWINFQQDIMAMEMEAAKGTLQYKWLIPDSMTNMCRAAMNYILYNDRGMRRELKVGASVTFVPKSFDAYKAEQAEIYGMLQRLFCLGHVVCTFHTAPERAPEHTAENPKYTGKVTVDPPRAIDLLALFNEQWLMRPIDATNYEIQTKPDWKWVGKTALKIDATEKGTLTSLLTKHRSAK